MLDRYGVDNYGKTEEFKEKIKETSLKKYGCESPNMLQENKDKKKKSMLDKYGHEYCSQVPEIREKMNNTMIERYGVKYTFESKEKYNQIQQTIFDIYNVTHISQSPEVQAKIKATKLERYGNENYRNSEKIAETCFELYDDKFYRNKEQAHATMLERYGTPYGCCVNNSFVRVSKPQTTLFDFIKTKYLEAELEVYLKDIEYSVDIFIPSINTIIEMYGDYWHCNPSKYKSDYYQQRVHKTAQEIWLKDQLREQKIKEKYNLVIVWESEVKKIINNEIKLELCSI